MPRKEKRATFLKDLGRATMRGVRKCYKCGTLNGTRGFSCKNKSCDVIFKEAGEKRKLSTEACRISAGTDAQIYSVRVRDKGPDYRGFVQTPFIQSVDGTGDLFVGTEPLGDPVLLVQMGAKCYVEPCQRTFEKLTIPNQQPTLCSHIRAASQCFKEATSLTLKNSILNSLPIPQSVKSDIWQLATDTPGPLVQRVSKNIMVVKCKPEALHPLGFLHFSFKQVRNKEESEYKYYCGCRAFKIQPAARDIPFRKCVHLYACVVAFASDAQLAQEFAYYINMIQNEGNGNIGTVATTTDNSVNSVTMPEPSSSLTTVGERSFLILNDSGDSNCQVEVEVLQDDSGSILDGIPISADDNLVQEDIEGKLEIQLRTPEGIHLRTSDGGTISVHQIPENLPLTGLKRRQDDSVVQASSALLTLQDSAKKTTSGKRPLKGACARKPKEPLDESTASLSFMSWLSSVVERINQTMHYGFNGHPDPLVFHMPKLFFDCLLNRINVHSKKKRLPNQTQTFIRRDAVPLGKFTKYTWRILREFDVRQIFQNTEIPLQFTQNFIQNRDGSFKPYNPVNENIFGVQGGVKGPLLKPQEFKTKLRMNSGYNGKDGLGFVIEWIPDILPQSDIGELRIRFEFDHIYNGNIVVEQQRSSDRTISQRTTGIPMLAPKLSQNEQHIIQIPITDTTDHSTISTILTF